MWGEYIATGHVTDVPLTRCLSGDNETIRDKKSSDRISLTLDWNEDEEMATGRLYVEIPIMNISDRCHNDKIVQKRYVRFNELYYLRYNKRERESPD